MFSRSSIIASIATGLTGVALSAAGLVPLLSGDALVVHGSMFGRQAVEFPSLAPLLSLVVGVVLVIVGALVLALRGDRGEVRLAPIVAANAPLIVAREGDGVTFYWAESHGTSRRRGTPRAALTHA